MGIKAYLGGGYEYKAENVIFTYWLLGGWAISIVFAMPLIISHNFPLITPLLIYIFIGIILFLIEIKGGD